MKRTRYMFNFERYYGKIFKEGTAIVKKSKSYPSEFKLLTVGIDEEVVL